MESKTDSCNRRIHRSLLLEGWIMNEQEKTAQEAAARVIQKLGAMVIPIDFLLWFGRTLDWREGLCLLASGISIIAFGHALLTEEE